VPSNLVSRADTVLAVSAEILEELKSIYVDLERDLNGLPGACEACGECCHFASFDHELRLTELELAYLIDCHGLRRPVREGICPYLEDARCVARLGRTLGCRVFNCRADKTKTEDLYDHYFLKIRELAKKHGLTLTYGELLEALGEITVSQG
jgi:Fe-S-cluster containining protein